MLVSDYVDEDELIGIRNSVISPMINKATNFFQTAINVPGFSKQISGEGYEAAGKLAEDISRKFADGDIKQLNVVVLTNRQRLDQDFNENITIEGIKVHETIYDLSQLMELEVK